jgi:hypothetical protein
MFYFVSRGWTWTEYGSTNTNLRCFGSRWQNREVVDEICTTVSTKAVRPSRYQKHILVPVPGSVAALSTNLLLRCFGLSGHAGTNLNTFFVCIKYNPYY